MSSSNAKTLKQSPMGPPQDGHNYHHRGLSHSVSFNDSPTRRQNSESGSPSPSIGAVGKDSSSSKEAPKGRALSCSECKRRKIKCDRANPCGPCVLRNEQDRCKPVIRWEAGCSLSEFTLLQNRVKQLEGRLGDMQQVLEGVTGSSMGGGDTRMGLSFVTGGNKPDVQSRTSPMLNPSTAQNSGTATTQRAGNGEDDAVMMLEDFAMGNRANARRAAQKLNNHESRSGGSPDSSLYNLETGASQRSADASIDVAYRFLRMLPEPEVSKVIIEFYFDRLEWHTKCLHRKSYMKDVQQLFGLDLETSARTIRPSFLCVHFMVVCIAIHLASGDQVKQWGIDPTTAMHLCDALFAGSQQLLWASDFIGCHQLEHLQAVVLISVYAYNVDEQADAAFALVGASIKIAQNLCFNRLDDAKFMEKERIKNRLVSGGRDVQQSKLERELSKRVWWYLIWLDWSHALSHGGSYAINPAHNRTNLPANVNDEDLESDESLRARPLEEYTSTSFTIWRLRFLIVYRETIDMINQPGGITHGQVLEMDKKLMNLLHGLPSYFQLPEDSKKWMLGDSCHDMELLSIQITGHNRILRLHRPYLAKGLQDRNSISRKRCVEAAFSILSLFRQARSHAPIILRVWINIYYVFSGALVLFLDLCYDSEADAQAALEKRMAVREMLDICSEARHLSAAAKNTYNLLQGLLEAETELRGRQEGGDTAAASSSSTTSLSSGKRKREESGAPTTAPFVSLVERVLTDAATKHGGGESSATSSTSHQQARSPGDILGVAFGVDPPAKRHSATSFVRDRAGSNDHRLGRGSPLAGTGLTAGSSSHTASSSGAGHGGYFNDSFSYNNGRSGGGGVHSGSNGGGGLYTPGGSSVKGGMLGAGGSASQPTSPWGSHSAVRSTAWNVGPSYTNHNNNSSNNNNNNSFSSPTSGTAAAGYGSLTSPTTTTPSYNAAGDLIFSPSSHHQHSNSNSSATGRTGALPPHLMANPATFANMSNTSRVAETTNGLSSLLDEDIFSNVLMGQTMGVSEWENAFAFVAPHTSAPPHQ